MRDVLLPGLAVVGVAVLVALLAGAHPILTRMAARNALRRRSRIVLVTFGLLIGTAIICSSLAVGDTLGHIFTGDVYERLDAVDVTVSNEVNEQRFDFPEPYFHALRNESLARGLAFDGMAPVLERVMPIRNNLTGKQAITVHGLDDAYESGFGPLLALDGSQAPIADLPPDGVYVNERAARDLNASAGDILTLFWGTTNASVDYVRVAGLVRDEGKARYEHMPIVFRPLADAQRSFDAASEINLIKVSAPGPVIGGEERSALLAQGLRDEINRQRMLAGSGWNLAVREVKADGLEQAQVFADQATELFLVMGSFAIIAGVLLIVNVFVMLAEERKPEMGVSRAIGLKRAHLTLSFLFEGSLYAAIAAAAGALAGLALGWIMIAVFNLVFPPEAGAAALEFFVDPASVLLAFAAGVLITILAVALASAFVSRLNIVQAIRNLAERREDGLSWAQRWLVFLTLLGGVLFLIRGFGVYRLEWPPLDFSEVHLVAAAVGLAAVNGWLLSKVFRREAIARATGVGIQAAFAALVIAGGYHALTAGVGPDESLGAYRVASVPLLAIGLGTAASRVVGFRIAYSLAGLSILWWLLYPPVGLVDQSRDNLSILFVETGFLLVVGAILVAVFNTSPILRFAIERLGGKGRPVARAAVTYPMAKKFRTGLTVAMFALSLFSITVIAMIQGLQAASLDAFVEGQSGGYEIAAYANGYVPIQNFSDELVRRGISLDNFDGGEEGIAEATVLSVQVNKSGDPEKRDYTLWGVDNFLIQKNTYEFQDHLPTILYDYNNVPTEIRLNTREDVWRALQLNRSYAVVDRGAAGADQFTPDVGQLRLNLGNRVFATDAEGNVTREFVILGILEQSLQFTQGIFVDRETVTQTYDLRLARTAYFFQLAPGVDARTVRAELEEKFFVEGLITIDVREEITTQFDQADRVLLLMQAYLAIGLVVGVTGLGVITIRAVVERRQEIGVMRALGFTRRMVRNVFLLEIALIASLGIAIGMGLGVVLAQRVWEAYFSSIAVFAIPWMHLATVAAIAFGFALLATAGPALRASRLPPAETLRYVE